MNDRLESVALQNQAEITQHVSPRISLILVHYNGWDYLSAGLTPLIETTGSDCEIIVFDNASTDGAAEIIDGDFPQVRLVRSNENLGFAAGSNRAASYARGRYLVFLNQDTLVEPGWLEPLIEPLESDPRVGLTTPQIVLMDDPQQVNACGNEIHISGLTLCRGAGLPRGTLDQPAEMSAVSGAAFAIRRELFVRLGGFDEDFFMYMEDTDLSLRARLAGYRCWYVPESVVQHDYALTFGAHKTFYQERNRYQMLLKSLRWRALLALAPALLLGEVVAWGYVLVRQRDQLIDKLRAYLWIARHWSEIMDRRGKVQASREVGDRAWLGIAVAQLGYEQTGTGPAARWARRIFDPLFWLARRLALVVVRN